MEITDIETVKIDIVTGWNPRSRIKEEYTDMLGKSISRDGQLAAISVVQRGDRYQLIDGECRVRGARKEGLRTLRARVYGSLSEPEMYCIALKHNLTQSTLGDLDVGITLKKMAAAYGWSHLRLATEIGKKQTWVSAKIALATRISPKIRELFSAQRLNFSHALILSRLPYEEQDTAVIEIMRSRKTSREAREYVNQLLGGNYNLESDTPQLVAELKHIVAIVDTIVKRHMADKVPLSPNVVTQLRDICPDVLDTGSRITILLRRN